MKKKLAALLLVGTMVFSVMACTSDSSNESTEISQEKSEKPVYLEETEISDLFSNPENFKGKYVKLSGKIFNGPDKEENYVAYQAWHDIQNSDKDFVFGMENPEEELSQGDYVIVDGVISGAFEGENIMGGTISCPMINAVSIERQSYMDAVVPTISEIVPENAMSEQNGIVLKVDKVEFAEKETRIYLTESNSSADKFSMWVYSIKIVQNGQQIEQDFTSSSSYEGNYAELSTDILPNASSSGVLVFPAMDSSAGFQIYAEGSSDNYELDFQPFTIDISPQ